MTDTTPSAYVDEVLHKWTARFIANGVGYGDLNRLRDSIGNWVDYLPAFVEVGEEYLELADEALDRGCSESASDHLWRAAMYFHFASHVWHFDDERSRRVHHKAVMAFDRSAELSGHTYERIETPLDGGGQICSMLHVPDRGPGGTTETSPLVIMLPGLDSIKEELHAYAAWLHNRGVATLSIDGPGQGETWHSRRMTAAYPEVISKAIDAVIDRDVVGIDHERLGVYGVSLGGFYAPYVAAYDHRITACVGVSGPYSVGPVSEWATPLLRDQFLWACKTESIDEVDEITRAMTLTDAIDDLTIPTLIVTGSKDAIIAPARSKRIADQAVNGEFLLYEGASHVCNDIHFRYRPRIADWLRSRLT